MCRIAILLFLGCLTAGPAFAGTFVTIEIEGVGGERQRISAEIVGFADGQFTVRRPNSEETRQIPAEQIHAIDFGADPQEGRITGKLDPETIMRMATPEQFGSLSKMLGEAVRAGRRGDVIESERRLARAAEEEELASERRMHLLYARLLAVKALGEEKAAARLQSEMKAEFPSSMLQRVEGREPPRPEGERRERSVRRDGERDRDVSPEVHRETDRE